MDEVFAVVSDVHGNREALQTVFADIDRRGIQKVYCLGDIVGYGEAGAWCLSFLRERGVVCVQGNHDGNIDPPRDPGMREEALAVLAREHEILDEADRAFLIKLPAERVVEDAFVMVHGALTGRDDYILNTAAVRRNREILRERYAGLRFLFFGHTHLPMVIQGGWLAMEFPETTDIETKPADGPVMVNPGAVGQPRDRNPAAAYAVVAPADDRITIVRLPYDVAAEQERMNAAGIDERLVRRLAAGA